MSCYCDSSGPDFMSERVYRARKQHVCCECRTAIQPGRLYEAATGKWDGNVNTYKTCMPCARLREALTAADTECGCAVTAFRCLRSDAQEFIENCLEGEGWRLLLKARPPRYVSSPDASLVPAKGAR